VGLGLVVAVALAAGGGRLRRAPGTRRFGDVLLAIALAVVHVDAWGAGPTLGLVAPGVALAAAAAASAALAALAWRAREQWLFVVGVGGALVAPFVTQAAAGHPFVLPLYGWLVLTVGLLALPRAADDPPWPLALGLLGLGSLGYVGATTGDASAARAIGNPAGLVAWTLRADVPAAFALASALAALALGGARLARRPAAGGVALAHLGSTLLALFALALGYARGAPRLVGYALAATIALAVALAFVPSGQGVAPRPPGQSTPPGGTTRARRPRRSRSGSASSPRRSSRCPSRCRRRARSWRWPGPRWAAWRPGRRPPRRCAPPPTPRWPG
jgi:hypothetical protein